MPVDQFEGFVVVTSGQRAVFSVGQNSSPLWVIDTTLLAGNPTLTIKRLGSPNTLPAVPSLPPGKILNRHVLSIVLSNARYPGTDISADLSMSFLEVITQDDTTFDVSLNLSFGGASFAWSDGGFSDWLRGTAPATTQVAVAGLVMAFQDGGTISFGPAATAALTLTPGQLNISAGNVCTVSALGVAAPGDSIGIASSSSSAQTTIVVRSSAPYAVPLPSLTPLGSLTAEPGFDILTVLATETGQNVTFSADQRQSLYTLELIDGIRDLSGAPVSFDLLIGQVVFVLGPSPVATFLSALAATTSKLWLTGGIGLRVPPAGDSAGILGLQLSFDGASWKVIQATVPLPGLFVTLDDGAAEPGTAPDTAVLSLVPAGKNWLQLGPLPAGKPRLHIEDFAVHITRPADLLNLELSSTNMAFEAAEGFPPMLSPLQAGGPAFWRVILPPQHVLEQAFYQGSEQPNLISQNDDPLTSPPTSGGLAGPTRLAFFVPADVPPFPITLSNLLDWTRYEQAGTSLDNTDVPYTPPAPLQPPDPIRQTAIELPMRLFVSPDSASGWNHATTTATDISELWHTRLGLRKQTASGTFLIDERPSAGLRQGRAFWSPDFPSPSSDPFKSSLTGDHRNQIVQLTSGSDPAAHTFDIQRLMLSALGGTALFEAGWNPPPGFSLTLWHHETSHGRDQYVRVAERGFLFPFGHRAAKVIVTERRFLVPPGSDHAVAYSVQFDYIIVTQPVRSYASLDLPFTEIEFVTRITPALNQPQPLPASPSPGVHTFWIIVGTVPFPFEMAATDLLGRKIRFQAPAIFVQDDSQFQGSVTAAGSEYANRASFNQPLPFGRQKIGFAPSQDEESTSFEAATLSLASNVPDPNPPPAWKDQSGNPLFRPKMAEAEIHHAAAVALAGGAETVRVNYFDHYVRQARAGMRAALDSPVDVFLTLPAPPSAKLGADKTGVAAPGYSLTGISRSLGAVGGNLNDVANGIFDPDKFLDNTAKLMGQIDLRSVLGVTRQIPNLRTNIVTAPDGTRSSVTTFDWHPPLKDPDFQPGGLTINFTGGTLDLNATITTQLSASPLPPSSELHGRIGSFRLEFAGLIALNFTSMRFDSVSAKKPSIDVQLDPANPVEFLNDLSFINALRDLIPAGGFSPSGLAPNAGLAAAQPANGPFLDVTSTAIIAGFSLAIPSVGFGVFSLENIRLGAALTLPFEDKPVSFSFNFAERDHKFLLTVDLLAGGGYLLINLDSSGIQQLEFAIEFGANVALDLFVATGSAHILAGVSLIFSQSGQSLTGYLRAGGELTVLGLVSISIDFMLSLTYENPPGDLHGIASLSVEVSVAFISKSVTLTLERRFQGGGGLGLIAARGAAGVAGSGAPALSDLLTEEDWAEYAGAFA